MLSHALREADRRWKKEFGCSQEGCTYRVRSTDEGETVHVVREHAQNRHDTPLTDGEIRKGFVQSAR
jgi:predicted small metal-binding protein